MAKSYVISAECEGVKKYVFINFSEGTSVAVDLKSCATPLPNRVVANAVIRSIRPVIKRHGLNVKLSVEVLDNGTDQTNS